MQSLSTYRLFRFALALFLLLGMLGCEGLDDWSDLKGIDLLNSSKNDEGGSDSFKRYTIPGLSAQPIVQSIYDPSVKFSVLYNAEVRKACDYTKLPFYSTTLGNWNASLHIAATTRVIMVYDTKKLNDASIPILLDFVIKGGTLFIPFASEDRRMAFLLVVNATTDNL